MATAIHNTFHIPATANRYVEYTSVEELQDIIPTLQGRPFLHIGGGSNLLFTRNYEGTIIHSRILGAETVEEDADTIQLRVGSGEVWDDFVAHCVSHGWYGAENLSLIPGEVGASAVQNIGAYGVEAKDLIDEVECIDLVTGEWRVFNNSQCNYAYRSSIFKHELKGRYAVVYVDYRLSKHFRPKLEYGNLSTYLEGKAITPATVRQAIIDIRRSKLPDPEVLGNAGSFFMNPVVSIEKYEEIRREYPDVPHYDVPDGVKIPAGWLIEQCGWKGKALGRAAVHDRQALVLVNLGGATGAEVLHLCHTIQSEVSRQFGIDINPEVNVI
ncbi:MAG: UDP-N-acetylmuramate dehydrogenase [Bacteroidaceae bacterium]|nr:UDP-N-acetylmuramate dehydrogenase [Bacteroidaceae bacterium]